MAARGRPPGQVKSGGRVKGSLDKNQRQLITGEIANDILQTYKKLGGPKFLLKWATENPSEFIRQCLARLMPPMARDGDGDVVQVNTQVNIDSEFEAARRIAFALSKATYAFKEREPVATMTPQEACNPRWQRPDDVPDTMPLIQPEPIDTPDQARWASELKLSPEQRRDNALIRETETATLESYAGSSSEQALARRRSELL
ncbi:hypothetical protein NVV94_05710 [Pseudomonas sp. LS1212]|uniref:hypothetical protein n=1 Tax=Pseudomonas sp. LS1212 TaxID=2972478 RepID=UPI00215CF78D|nr:hypothetical protein [Pseudomonas sp. LS1212]UVJ45078.1 hypothetical protein NVV94_05710 [Pseudomonas sp. LS1212]